MKYIQQPDYVQYTNEMTAIVLFDFALFALLVVIPVLIPQIFHG